MSSWLQQNTYLITVLTSLGTLAIWFVYLNIFWRSHRRQITPVLLIDRGEGRQLSARCFVTNMSKEAVFVQGVAIELRKSGSGHRVYISDAEDLRHSERPSGWHFVTRLGPLGSGELVDMGSFESILDYAVHVLAGEDRFKGSALGGQVYECEITIIGIYGSEDMVIGASRRFRIEHHHDSVRLRAATVETRQITSSRERRRLARELAEQL